MASPFSFADLNMDGVVDDSDLQIFQSSLNNCFGSVNFNANADLDGDGCITADDNELFVGLFDSSVGNHLPEVRCKSIEVMANDSCKANVSPSDIDDGSTDPDGDAIVLALEPAGPFSLGRNPVTLIATDSHGASSSCSATVTVVDRTPPVLTNAFADKPELWPPNHKMVDVAINYNASDNCGAINCQLNVSSNEPINGTGDGDTAPDWQVVDLHHVRLRAERAGGGNYRVYTTTILCTDNSGNRSTGNVTVKVPKSQGQH